MHRWNTTPMLRRVLALATNTSDLIPIRSWQMSSSFVIVSPPPFRTFQYDTNNGMIRAKGGSGKWTSFGGLMFIVRMIFVFKLRDKR